MTSADVAIIAALGASLLTVLGTVGVVYLREWRTSKAQKRALLTAAVLELLSRSMTVAMRARTMREAMGSQAGHGWKVDDVLGKPADLMQLHDWLTQDISGLIAALSQVWILSDEEGIRLADDVAGRSLNLIGAGTGFQPAGPDSEVQGSQAMPWSPQLVAANDQAWNGLDAARRELADYTRTKLGEHAVKLAHVEPGGTRPDESDPAPAG
jgi:hypothetical protein